MIYNIAEYAATGIESVILCIFLISVLGFKPLSLKLKVCGTVGFITLIILNAFIWERQNILFNCEHLLTATYILLLFVFSRVMLQGKWWDQAVFVLTSITAVFLINLIIISISGKMLDNDYSDILLMRNPTRVFLLFISKAAIGTVLLVISNFINKSNYTFRVVHGLVTITVFILAIIVGITMEKLVLNDIIPSSYAAVIMVSLSIISVLLIYIIAEISIRNIVEQNRIALQTRLETEKAKYKELAQWNSSIKSIQHDMNNHLLIIRKYIEENDLSGLNNYIDKIQKNTKETPIFINSGNDAVDAILNVKKSFCKKENIDLKCYLQTDLPEYDVYLFSTIFGNLIDNAIEHELMEDIRQIKLSVTAEGNNIRLIIQNKISHNVLLNGKIPQTTKSDKEHHGIGLENVTNAIARLHGTYDYYEKDNWFVADVEIPVIKID